MWIPNIVEKERLFDKIKIIVEFTNSIESYTDVYYIDSRNMDQFKTQVQYKIDRLQELDDLFPTIKKEQLDTTVETSPAANLIIP